MTGKLTGIGIGPGDPELMTLKAVRCIEDSDIVAIPGEAVEESIAYKIALGAVPALIEKEVVPIAMPMTKDPLVLAENHDRGRDRIEEYLDQGKNVSFLTLGDPTVYSTYMYVHKRVKEDGYETEIISGIPSFCAVAARFGISLGEKADEIHIIPASYQIEEALTLPGTKILMKAGRNLARVKEILLKIQNTDVYMIENCGMEEEHMYNGAENMPDDAGYYTLLIVKERG